jgi:hypothetical protein
MDIAARIQSHKKDGTAVFDAGFDFSKTKSS